ncbi:MAG: hypothetical protein QGI68_14955 [Pseudomonadales bacterium]|jgi:hypothetical protein|nr:hypothetical protein [Pseudomonadales bacterium]MDP7146468.1 hypothetical protein [Pseudomonadales bacterium]MDP7358648.1 hypothetical protein [Pseudomonadales bacterium]MDP7596847.1 hypothetical protein [Pseudomonadales bacterium]HJN52239.1 hypothetical protein [Pseudomonadales bacterium]|tara:strand:+ start:1784 stop:2134 length:351 start_codon:yes stop_codon:yes gene_type:complete
MWKQILVATANLLYAIAGEQKGTGNTTTSKADWLEKKDRLTQSDRELLNMIEDSYQITLKNIDSNFSRDCLPKRLHLLMAVGFIEEFEREKFRVTSAYAPHASLSTSAKTTFGMVD